MRLDKYLANNSLLSRKEVKAAIKRSSVSLNGEPATNGNQQVTDEDIILLEDIRVEPLGAGYFMLNKPTEVICANSDPIHTTVFDLIDEPHSGLHVAGRLDIDTTGLVLITGDGVWSHKITSPKYSCEKRYRVRTDEFITEVMIEKLQTGVFLREEQKRTKPAKVKKLSSDEILLSISEGRYHQVKRMLAAVGNRVESLHREAIGEIELDGDLLPGEYRALTESEVSCVG